MAACCGPVLAQPSGLSAVHGSATVTHSGNTTTITTVNGAGTQHSALDWQGFGVAGGKTVYFAQPSAQSTSINRVLGGDPSRIEGTLGSNGRLVLVNPAGIAVSSGAVVDTAGFTASTLFMSRSDAVAGKLLFDASKQGKREEGDGKARNVEVQGRILARNGDVVLIGPAIEAGQGAIIEARGGDVILAAGRTVELTGRGLEGIHLAVRAKDDEAVNLGTLAGDSVAIFAGKLRHSGLIQAQTASVEGGKVVLQGIERARLEGKVQASTGGRGGSVRITAEKVELKSSASVDVRHAHGGGEILVGGGWQGEDARIANAEETDVDSGVRLRADATVSGTGGTVVVWSTKKTTFAGQITARGAGAPGGQVEVSSAGKLEFKGSVDVGSDPAGSGPEASDPGQGGSSGKGGGQDKGNANDNANGSGSGKDNGGAKGNGKGGSGGSADSADSGTGGSGPSDMADADTGTTGAEAGNTQPASPVTVVPLIPVQNQAAEVQTGVAQANAVTQRYLAVGPGMAAPDSMLALFGVSTPAASGDADWLGVLGGAPDERSAQRRRVLVTNGVCRPGS